MPLVSFDMRCADVNPLMTDAQIGIDSANISNPLLLDSKAVKIIKQS